VVRPQVSRAVLVGTQVGTALLSAIGVSVIVFVVLRSGCFPGVAVSGSIRRAARAALRPADPRLTVSG
jgi:hypothetical protein